MATPTISAEVTVGGSVRLDTGWVSQSKEASDTDGSRTDSFWEEPGISRVNFTFTAGDLTGFIELSSGVGLRHIYGTWAFAEGSELLVGHTWSILTLDFADQRLKLNNALLGAGNIYGGRAPQLRYTRAFDFGKLMVALVVPEKPEVAGMTGTEHAIIPKIEGAVDFKVADATITPSFSFNTFEVENVVEAAGGDEDVTSWVIGCNLNWPLAVATIRAEAYYGKNLFIYPAFYNDHGPTVVAGEVDEDTTGYGGWLQLSLPFEPVTIHVGAGMDVASNDGRGTVDEQTAYSIFGNIQYNITENFYIQPEISLLDYGKNWNDEDRGTETYYGIHWQIDF